MAIILRDPVELVGEDVQLTGHAGVHDELLAAVEQLGELLALACEFPVDTLQRTVVSLVDEYAVDLVEEVVPARSCHRPISRQGLVASEYLLHDNVQTLTGARRCSSGVASFRGRRAGNAVLQACEILHGVEEPVDVVDTESGDGPFGNQTENQLVSCPEHFRILHPKSRQFIDIEKATVVDLMGRRAPVRQPVRQGLQKLVQTVEALRVPGPSVEGQQGPVDVLSDGRCFGDKLGQTSASDLLFTVTFHNSRAVGFGIRGKVAERGDHTQQFHEVGVLFAQLHLQCLPVVARG